MGIYRIKAAEKVAVTTTAKDVAVNYRSFLIENADAEATIYFKEKDGKAATASNGFALRPGAMVPVVLTGKTLSVVGSDAADLRILYVDID